MFAKNAAAAAGGVKRNRPSEAKQPEAGAMDADDLLESILAGVVSTLVAGEMVPFEGWASQPAGWREANCRLVEVMRMVMRMRAAAAPRPPT